MKILWVEDFGGRLAPSKIVVAIFKELFEGANLGKLYKENPDVGGQLSELFREHTLHEIHVCRSYVEWKKLDEQQGSDFDVALIDINLSEYSRTPADEMPEGIESPNFDKGAGLRIYHQLIKKGFADNNIAFFTGEGQSLEEFSRYCGEIFLDRPAHCFEKDPLHFEELRRWLLEKSRQESLILRRGIIEGCSLVREKIESAEVSVLESQLIFYRTTPRNVSADPEVFRLEALDYLTRLERFFLPHQNDINAHPLYLFVKELAAKWEESYGHFIRAKERPRFETRLEERFFNTAQFQMKLLRNWCAHSLLSPQPAPKDVAYFFILAMRSLLRSDVSRVTQYEKILSPLFSGARDAATVEATPPGLEFHLERSYIQLNTLYEEMGRYAIEPVENRRHDNHFLATFKGVGELLELVLRKDEAVRKTTYELYRRRVRECSLRLFYQSYWHGLFPLYMKPALYANLQSVGFNLQPVSEPFLSFLGGLIFGECFDEESVPATAA
jgi:hypothetical protein